MKLLNEGFYGWHVSKNDIDVFDDEKHEIVTGNQYGLGTYYEVANPEKNYNLYHQGRDHKTQYKVYFNLKDDQVLNFTEDKSLIQLNKKLSGEQINLMYKGRLFSPMVLNVISEINNIRSNKNYYEKKGYEHVYQINADYDIFERVNHLKNIMIDIIGLYHFNNVSYNVIKQALKKMGLLKYFEMADAAQADNRNYYDYHIKDDNDFTTLHRFANKVESMLMPLIRHAINSAPAGKIFQHGYNDVKQIKLMMANLGIVGFIVNPAIDSDSDLRYLILWKNKGIVSIVGRRKKLHQQFDDEAEAEEIANWMAMGDAGGY